MEREPDTADSTNSPLIDPTPHETNVELYAKLIVGMVAFGMFCFLAGWDVTHPAVSIPEIYLWATLGITGGVFGLDIIQRNPPRSGR